MKRHLINSFLIVAVAITATSCLKDRAYDNGEIQSGQGSTVKAISLGLTTTDTTNFLIFSVDLSDNDTTVNLIPVTLGALQVAQQDVHVTLVANNTLVDDYNNVNGADYQVPTGLYTLLDNGVVTIPKGSSVGYLKIKFKPSDFLGADWAVGYSISSVAESGYTITNLSKGVVAIGIKNRWDGLYTLTQKTTGWSAYGIADGPTYTWPKPVVLTTSSGFGDVLSTNENGAGQPAFTAAGGTTSFGATSTQFTFDASNNVVDVNNQIPDDGRGRTFHLNPAVTDNRYDPATKTIFVSYVMTQNGRPNQLFYDTLVYVKSR